MKFKVSCVRPDELESFLNENSSYTNSVNCILSNVFTNDRNNRVETNYQIIYRVIEEEELSEAE